MAPATAPNTLKESRDLTARWEHNVARGYARVQYGHTYIEHQHVNHVDSDHSDSGREESGGDSQRADFLKALAFEHMDSRYNSIDPAHAETCRWLFEKPEYLGWQSPEQRKVHHGFLWIKGKAGSGKSTMMKCALDYAKENLRDEKAISFFFNARGHIMEKSVAGMYRSLLSQLLRSFPYISDAIPASGAANIKQQDLAVPSLRNYFGKAILQLRKADAVACYVDALDECDEDEMREAMEHFEELGTLSLLRGINFYVCFASRHYPQITVQHCVELNVEAQREHENDIEQYIHSKLAIRDARTRSQLASQIQARSSGVFFWVVLVVRTLKKKSDKGASRSELMRTLKEVPDKLQEMIANVLQSPDDNLISTMAWVLFTARPLSLRELYFAVRTSTGDLDSGALDHSEVDVGTMAAFILASSRGLVEAKPVQLVHESVREYLLAGGLAKMESSAAEEVSVRWHSSLFRCCRTYIQLDQDVHSALRQKLEESQDSATKQEILERYPFIGYAVENILHHARLSSDPGSPGSEQLLDFPLEAWAVLYYLFKEPECINRCHAAYLRTHFNGNLATSLLLKAVELESPSLIHILSAHGADTSDYSNEALRNVILGTARKTSVAPKDPHLLGVLLDHGSDPNLRWRSGVTPLEYVAGRWSSQIVQIFLDHQSYIPDKTSRLLVCASEGLNIEVVRLLLHRGVSLDDKNAALRATLRINVYQGYLVAISGYFSDRVVGKSRHEGRMAVLSARMLIVRTLLDAGAEVNVVEGEYETALIETSAMGCVESVGLLLTYGANLHHQSKSHGTAIDAARKVGRSDIVAILERA